MAESESLSQRAYHRLLKLGLSPKDVDVLLSRIRRQGRVHDGARCRAALVRAAQGGDPVALKLVSLPAGDAVVGELALAYGDHHVGH